MASAASYLRTSSLAELLASELPGRVRQNVSLSEISRWRIGGPAAIYVEPRSTDEAARLMSIMADRTEPFFVMGDSTNTLFDDRGFSGVILRIGRNLSATSIEGNTAWAQAGAWVPRFSRAVGSAGLSGIEHTIGIPGTLGGLIAMNGGSQRKGIGSNVVEVLCADEFGRLFRLDQEGCEFSYRSSVLQERRAVILEAKLEFTPSPRGDVLREMLAILRDRRRKFPQKYPNCGSTFLSNPSMYEHVGPPGKVIEDAGFKGLRKGGAQVSTLHANFINNLGGASALDVLAIIGQVRSEIADRTGYSMDCEVKFLRLDGRLEPAHIEAERIRNSSHHGLSM